MRSRTSPEGEAEFIEGVERARKGRKVTDDGKTVGLDGPRKDVNVLGGG